MKKNNLLSCLLAIALNTLSFCSYAQTNLSFSSYSNQTEIKSNGSITLLPGFTVPSGSTVRIYIETVPTGPFASQPSATQNYVSTKLFKISGVTAASVASAHAAAEVNQTIQYLDGLARPMQNVDVQASPSFKDLVQPITYDAFGRENLKYEPYALQDPSNGTFRSSGINEQSSFFSAPTAGIQATSYPFSETVFENSPLSRVLQQGAQGSSWQVSQGHTDQIEYATNVANEVKLWSISGTTASGTAYYDAGRLYKTVTRDQNVSRTLKGGSVEEFKDVEGHIVLKRYWQTETTSLSTYYIYSVLGNLQYVLPPAVNENGPSSLSTFGEGDDSFNKYIYGYHYDGRNRVIEKKIPGKAWEYFVYNQLDQLVLSQDGVQHAKSTPEWNFIKYDPLGRVIISGLYTSAASASSLLDSVNNAALWETAQSGGIGYTSLAFPRTAGDNYQINYYDNYNFPNASNYSFTGGSSQTMTLLTGKLTRVIGTTTMLQDINYYDSRARLIKNFHQHYLGGGSSVPNYDETTNTYDFSGELLLSSRDHHANNAVLTISTRMEYDHQGRLVNTYKNINSQGEILLSKNTYNEIGQLQQKSLHNGLQNTSYTYNERGWLKSLTSNEFSERLNYEDGTVAQWNGNISGQSWGTATTLPNVFTYGYDLLNRLSSANSTGVVMGESISYDFNGNIAQLTRDGTTGTYNYSGNQLSGITGGLATSSYSYDNNGNAITDGRNGVSFGYNYLNLPQSVSKSGLAMTYVYDASGNKLQKISNTAKTDYINGIQYSAGQIDFIQTEEGLARNNSGTYSYEYNLSDHLGNTRLSFYKNPVNGNLEVLQQDDYYAFGLRKSAKNGVNKYLYNKKELQEELGQYDYGARFYDPVIGRWNVVDPKAELGRRFSPYVYGNNNPIRFVDQDGKKADDITIYGIDAETKKQAPLVVVKTDQYDIKQYTNLSASAKTDPLTVDLRDVDLKPSGADAYMVQAGVDFAFGGGTGGALQMVFINKGDDQGIYFYQPSTIDRNMGLNLSAGIAAGNIDFNENSGKPLTRDTFEGKSQGVSFGAGPFGATFIDSYTNGKWNVNQKGVTTLYSGSLASYGGGGQVGAQYSFTESKIIRGWSIPFKK
ncbi:DUF6443 domain-containing protein [Pedobacter sp. L105]|uniref:DUF6443 domain-containing protein n=1 Tax=Pedobacter sp. L105 TaxID=1641871 RepID=UPI00131CE035|nr:DUF6443 domain-containing protein [Pedobacter sp. L105]